MTSLSPAEVELDHIPRDDELPSGAFSRPHPQSNELIFAAFISQPRVQIQLLELAAALLTATLAMKGEAPDEVTAAARNATGRPTDVGWRAHAGNAMPA